MSLGPLPGKSVCAQVATTHIHFVPCKQHGPGKELPKHPRIANAYRNHTSACHESCTLQAPYLQPAVLDALFIKAQDLVDVVFRHERCVCVLLGSRLGLGFAARVFAAQPRAQQRIQVGINCMTMNALNTEQKEAMNTNSSMSKPALAQRSPFCPRPRRASASACSPKAVSTIHQRCKHRHAIRCFPS